MTKLSSAEAAAPKASLPAPSLFTFALEWRFVVEALALLPMSNWLAETPKGDGHSVLVMPGFVFGDESTLILRGFLANRGYDAVGWEMGRNFGRTEGFNQRITARLTEVYARQKRKVSLIGWSLGGVYARFLGEHFPDLVRQVITLGSPFARDLTANYGWRFYEMMSGENIHEIPEAERDALENPLPVPSSAIYSKTDGICAWQSCVQHAGPEAENIEVVSSHTGLGHHPAVLYAIADRLAQPEGQWRPFRYDGKRRFLFPVPSAD